MGGSKENDIQRWKKVERDREQQSRTGAEHTTLTLSAILKSRSNIVDQTTSSWAHPHKAEGTGSLEVVGYGNDTAMYNIVPIGFY
jgi:hypothetical protein